MITHTFLSITQEQYLLAGMLVNQIKRAGRIESEESAECLHVFFTGLLQNRLESAEIYFLKELNQKEQHIAESVYEELIH